MNKEYRVSISNASPLRLFSFYKQQQSIEFHKEDGLAYLQVDRQGVVFDVFGSDDQFPKRCKHDVWEWKAPSQSSADWMDGEDARTDESRQTSISASITILREILSHVQSPIHGTRVTHS